MFRVLVMDLRGLHEDEILSVDSSWVFLGLLYTCGLDYEFQWSNSTNYDAEMIVYA